MPTDERRAAARRRAWGRGPMILRFEPLESRQLLSDATVATALPDLVTSSLTTAHQLEWGDSFQARGEILNQGTAPANGSFKVDFYASPTPNITSSSVLIGETEIAGGLLPTQQAPFDLTLSLPGKPITGVSATGPVYVGMVIDPLGHVAESNKANDSSRGALTDTSSIAIGPKQPAILQGASLNLSQSNTTWGGTINVSTAVHNDGLGDAPATRARIVLTPAGLTPGSTSDVTIGNLNIPPIPAGQTVVVTQPVTLPAIPPSTLMGSTQFTLSVAQDADFATNTMSPHNAFRGMGFDMAQLSVATATDFSAASAPKPDLAPTTVNVTGTPLTFGQSFQVATTIQNQGNFDAGPYRVRFLLIGTNGSLSTALFLGDAQFAGLKAGYAQNILQTLQLPANLPPGVTLNAAKTARIAVQIDPEHALDESNRTNNTLISATVTLRVINPDGTSSVVVTPTTTTKKPITGTATTPAPAPSPAQIRKAKLALSLKKKHTLQHNLSVFPRRVVDSVKNLLHL